MSFKVQPLQHVNPKRRWISRLWIQTKQNIIWCCNTTSLHGFHYISNNHLSIFTRILFACVACSSVVLCSYLIALQLLEHQQQSILTTVRSTAYPVWRVRFPAVTICNFNVVYKDNIKNLMGVVKLRKINETTFMDVVKNLSALIANRQLANMAGFQEVFDELQVGGYTVDRLMAELAHPCENMVKQCFWKSKEIPCNYIFQSVKTSQGYCCAFNYYGTRDTAHQLDDPQSYHYQYVGGAGPTLGLRLVLDIEEEQYMSSIRPSSGLHVLVQDGGDYPDMDLIANTVQTNEELIISVTPRIYVGSESLRTVNFEGRHCLFEDEGHLDWSSVYTYKTCLSECKAKAILQYCQCVPYYYPLQISGTTRICTLLDVPCLQRNSYKYNALGINDDFFTAEALHAIRDRVDNIIECNCSPQCNKRMYDFHTDKNKAIQMDGFEFTNTSILDVYYSTVGCVKTDRDVYYTWDRVFASIGGIFGLCLGGSVISILECFYFMGRFAPHCRKNKHKVMKPKEPIKNFVNHRRDSYLGNRPAFIPYYK